MCAALSASVVCDDARPIMLDMDCEDCGYDGLIQSPTLDADTSTPAELANAASLVHPLIFCPPVGRGTRYALVVRKPWGQRVVVYRDLASSAHAPLNLARIRHCGAMLGVKEVILVPPAVNSNYRPPTAPAISASTFS